MQRLGLFVCRGCGIDAALDLAPLEALARGANASYAVHDRLCEAEGTEALRAAVGDGVDGLVLGACSGRCMVDAFRFDPRTVAVERVSLREQVAWTHPARHEDTQLLAEDLVRMGLARAAKVSAPKPLGEAIERTVLVVGGGVAGLNAARAAAALGHPVVLVEKETLGGYLGGAAEVVPTRPPYAAPAPSPVPALVEAVRRDPGIRVLEHARVRGIGGQPGQFAVTIETAQGTESLRAGSVVQATGARPHDPRHLAHLGWGKSPNVITAADLEKMLSRRELVLPQGGGRPRRVLFVQCAGSRDAQHLAYCSTECCATTLKHVAAIHRDYPEVACMVVYRDLRAPGQLEHFYRSVQDSGAALFTRGSVTAVESADDALRVRVNDGLLGDDVTLEADLVVLATGMVPNAADGEAVRSLRDARRRVERNESETQRLAAEKLVAELAHHEGTEILNLSYRQGPDLPVLRYGFPDSHYVCFPYETRRTGIYVAGTARAPMDHAQAGEDGWGAAMKAAQVVASLERGEAVHPRAGDLGIAEFALQRCTQCKRCTEECPFGALDEDEKGTPQYNPLRCRRCAICLGACPERIVSYPDYSVEAISSMIKAIEVPEEDEEKPRLLAFLCENDALPALDDAARQRLGWNAWMRVIPVRCLGAVNVVWIADALSRGIDGVLLAGCKRGDDYQCHYIKGSELAHKRMENLQETLTRLSLESERVRILEVGRDEMARLPALLDDFAATIGDIGPNPLKGF